VPLALPAMKFSPDLRLLPPAGRSHNPEVGAGSLMARVAVQALVLVALAATTASADARPNRLPRFRDAPIIFSDSVDRNATDIYRMDAQGRHMQTLAATPDTEGSPVLSPNAKRIAFARLVQNAQWETWVMNADGSNTRHLATGVPLSWSPDSRRLIVS
jgi:hypothetical protein